MYTKLGKYQRAENIIGKELKIAKEYSNVQKSKISYQEIIFRFISKFMGIDNYYLYVSVSVITILLLIKLFETIHHLINKQTASSSTSRKN